MLSHIPVPFTLLNAAGAAGIGVAYILLSSLIPEPSRQKFNAIMIGGAGAAYLNGGLGPWEFMFCTLMTFIAFKGLSNYTYIGIGWLLHSCWDIVHHLYGNPIVPFSPASSAGCAVCDAIMAIWFFYKAPSWVDIFRSKSALKKPSF
jgi:hypothetical protein